MHRVKARLALNNLLQRSVVERRIFGARKNFMKMMGVDV